MNYHLCFGMIFIEHKFSKDIKGNQCHWEDSNCTRQVGIFYARQVKQFECRDLKYNKDNISTKKSNDL